MTAGGAEKSQRCHKHFLQYSKFASERPQVRKWGRQTCFLPLSTPVFFNGVPPKQTEITREATAVLHGCSNIDTWMIT